MNGSRASRWWGLGVGIFLAATLANPPGIAGIAGAAGSAAGAPPASSLGTVRFPTSAGAAAQAAFLRGVAALHSFWYDEAAEAFRAAEKEEPGFALAYWGEAMTDNHPIWAEQDRAAALAALARLAPTREARAAKAPTARERGYLAAVEVLYGEDGKAGSGIGGAGGVGEVGGVGGAGDKAARDEAYAQAMGRLAAAYPDDDEAAAFHALALLGTLRPGDPAESQLRRRMAAAGALEEIFARHPDHPGVVHYLIHSYDDPLHAPLGLRAALVYARVAPAAPHALHMPSHIFVQLGRWDDAASSNEAAWAASVAWAEKKGLPTEKRDFHSLSWLHYAYLQQGRWAKAAETLEIARRAASEDPKSERITGALAGMEARQSIETGRGGKGAPPPAGTSAGEHYAHGGGAGLLAAGLAAARAGDAKGAAEVASRLSETAGKREGYAGKPFAIMAREVSGMALLAGGQGDAGIAKLKEAAELEAALDPPSGPPEPAKPAGELYGEALLARGRAAEAAHQFELALGRTPNRAAALFGAARAAAQRGDREGAERYAKALAALWHQADSDLPQLAELKKLQSPAR
jgi:tetratricopeptide (TPR) repeat protein